MTLEAALADPAEVVLHFSKNQGKKLGDLTKNQLDWYANTWQPKPEYATDQDWTLKAAAQQLANGEVVTVAATDTDDIPF